MRNEFCTLFDVNYLPRALVLYRSLEEVCDWFTLRAVCMDQQSKNLLDRLALPRLVAVGLDDLEAHDRALLEVKPSRTQVEYCWTATPAICLYALEREPELAGITYLDADLMFFSDPAPLYDEMGDDSVMIVPHRYAPPWEPWEETSGTYNVEWLTFRRDERGLEALRWWRDRCLEWCYFRYEDGKMGDQKYLDDWPERFAGVHVLEHVGGGLAPWNLANYTLSTDGGRVSVDGRPLVFFHYHSLRPYLGTAPLRRLALRDERFSLTQGRVPIVWRHGYPLTQRERTLIWHPYLRRLGAALQEIRRVEPGFSAGFERLARIAARKAARRGRGLARRALRAARRRVPRAVERRLYRDSWKRPEVRDQMLALATEQLREPETVAPYRSFLEIAGALVGEFRLPEPARLLDLGCGVGHYSELLERSFPGRFEYTGVDFSESMVDAARAAFPDRMFVVQDLFDDTLDLDSFDVVLASALVDVLPDYERALDLLLAADAPFVVLHRQRVTEGPSRAETAPGYDGQRTYRTFLNAADLETIAGRHGRRVAHRFHVEGEVESFILPKVQRDRA